MYDKNKIIKDIVNKENLGKYLNLNDIDIQFEFKPFINDFDDIEDFAVIFESGMPIKAFEVSVENPAKEGPDPSPKKCLEILYNHIKDNLVKYVTLPDISSASETLQQAYRGALESESGMYLIYEPTDKETKEIEEDSKKFNLQDVIELNAEEGGIMTYADLMYSFNDDKEVKNIINNPETAVFFDKNLKQKTFMQILKNRDLCNKFACKIDSDFLHENYIPIATKELNIKEINVTITDFSEDNNKVSLEVRTNYTTNNIEKYSAKFRECYFKHIEKDLIPELKKEFPNVDKVDVCLFKNDEDVGFGKTFDIDTLEQQEENNDEEEM